MPYDFLNNNPLLADMSPEKLQFLMNFATAKKPTDIKEMMPFLLSAMNSAKSNNIQFSEPETDLLFQILKQNMSAEESAKADKIMNLMKTEGAALKTAPFTLFCSVFLPDRRHRHFQHLVNRRAAVALAVGSLKITQACRFK